MGSAKSSDAVEGVPEGKKCNKQHVKWVDPDDKNTVTREGWNVSSDVDDYVWGWDPKEEPAPEKHGRDGAHLSYPFKSGECNCIVWITNQYRFLECVHVDADKKKCRFAVEPHGGHGKWTTVVWR